MKYEDFKNKISALCMAHKIAVRFFVDDNGRYCAKCSTGELFLANSVSGKITVRYGSGHQMQVAL